MLNHIIPYIGSIQFQQLTSEDIQGLLKNLKDKKNYSHSTVKKVYDCLNAVIKFALIKKDIIENPMLVVNMPDKQLFEKKEIRFFNKRECALIIEECGRVYSTGRPVYIYADVFILMLNTGIRMGEAIGLEKRDWDPKGKTLCIQRNVQSVQNRDENGDRLVGKKLITNTTKTYSGNRVLPLNKLATQALERLCAAHPESKYIVCDSKGNCVPPERLERTFYFLLKNAKLEKSGTHSLRHTFASMLFAQKVDIKTISKHLGHANIQITIDTYVHLFEEIDHSSVAQLDDIFCGDEEVFSESA